MYKRTISNGVSFHDSFCDSMVTFCIEITKRLELNAEAEEGISKGSVVEFKEITGRS